MSDRALSSTQFSKVDMGDRTEFVAHHADPYDSDLHGGVSIVNKPGAHNYLPSEYESLRERIPGDTHGNEQRAMLLHDYEPPTLDVLGVTKGDSHLVGPLLGLAAKHSLETYGRLPEASHNLSDHSAPLVRKLADRGVISMPAGEMKHNDADHSDAEYWIGSALDDKDYGHNRDLSPEEVASGSKMARSILRGAQFKKPPTKPDQPTLF